MIRKISFTQNGYDLLKSELHELTNIRKSAVIELQRSRELGDLSENSAYRVARQKVSRIDKRIRQINTTIKYAVVVKPEKNGTIQLGSSFSIRKEEQLYKLTLVNTHESNFEKGLLSAYSPIGKGVLGKKKGDLVKIITPNGVLIIMISDVA